MRDEAILSKLIDKKRVVVLSCLVLFMLSMVTVPSGYSVDITDEMIDSFGETLPSKELFYPSAEGGLSSDSITSFGGLMKRGKKQEDFHVTV